MQEEPRAMALRVQDMSSQALWETRQLQALQQSTVEELRQSVMDIGIKIQEQAQEKMTKQLSQQMQEKMASMQQQAVEATELAV